MNILAESTLKFCEYHLNGNEYFNAISAIFFFVLGIYIFLKRKSKIDLYFSIIVFLIGIFTVALHYTATILGQILDFSSMYLITLLLITLNIQNKFDGIKRHATIFFISIYFLCVILSFTPNFLINIAIFGITIVLTIATLHLIGNKREIAEQRGQFSSIILILVFGYCFWLLDYFQIYCSKELILVNGHIIWHLAMSIAYYKVWIFYRNILTIV